MKKYIRVVGAVMVNEKDEILCAQRPEGKNLALMWEFPGGKIEAGEAPAEALSLPLEARANRGPYRDAPTAETNFHGFAYGEALRLAREFAADRRARAIDADLRLTAVPFLEVLWRSFVRSHRALLHVGADGSPRWIGDLE